LTRRRLPPVTHTDALFADQSQSILDNLVAGVADPADDVFAAEFFQIISSVAGTVL
jgi:hypothetical protein